MLRSGSLRRLGRPGVLGTKMRSEGVGDVFFFRVVGELGNRACPNVADNL